MQKIIIAVGTDDLVTLRKGHFGDSKYFIIYKISKSGWKRLKVLKNKVKEFEEINHGDPEKFKQVIKQLKEVDMLVAWAMGPNYIRIRDQSNKVPYIVKGEARRTRKIDDALKEIVENFDNIANDISLKS